MAGKHTSGPWYPIRNSIGCWEVMTLRDADFINGKPSDHAGYPYGASICSGIGDHTERRTSGNEEDNARLIAAAPSLLDQHEADMEDLTLLLYAINEGDPKAELVMRVEDMKRRKRAAIDRATQPLPPPNEDQP